ncbi:universal stress protein [Nocardioides hankookensis]|uniref:Universal stress protein n=1 Tax=Nocardioides hankookensis TaxID=443157 RepID=A0ABW1LNQ3_9ACTN
MTRVVVAWSPDEFGRSALTSGVAEARMRGLGLVVVNASRGDALVDDRFASDDELAGVRAELEEAGLSYDVRQSVGLDVGDQVLDVAAEVDASLIVLGLRRRTPVGKLIMGSVAQRILLGAACPVLAVKPA